MQVTWGNKYPHHHAAVLFRSQRSFFWRTLCFLLGDPAFVPGLEMCFGHLEGLKVGGMSNQDQVRTIPNESHYWLFISCLSFIISHFHHDNNHMLQSCSILHLVGTITYSVFLQLMCQRWRIGCVFDLVWLSNVQHNMKHQHFKYLL